MSSLSIKMRRPLSSYVLVATIVFIVGLTVVSWQDRRILGDSFRGLRGGTAMGLLLAYTGSFLLVGAQLYTVVKRVGMPSIIAKMGGGRLWLNIHIGLSTIGFVAVLLHAGFPVHFDSEALFDHGLAGLATWALVVASVSGTFGRYIYGKLPLMRKAFSYWKPTHIVITAASFATAVIHMITVSQG